MNLPHAHRPRPGEDMASWDPGEAPPYTGRQLLLALGAAVPIVFVVGAVIALAFLFLGVSPEAHPGWW